jgi:hypothetical protein
MTKLTRIHMLGDIIRLPKGASLPVTLKVLEYELLHFYPLKVRLKIVLIKVTVVIVIHEIEEK